MPKGDILFQFPMFCGPASQSRILAKERKRKKKKKKEEINCNGYLRIVANGIEDDPGQTSWQLSCGSSPGSVIAR